MASIRAHVKQQQLQKNTFDTKNNLQGDLSQAQIPLFKFISHIYYKIMCYTCQNIFSQISCM